MDQRRSASALVRQRLALELVWSSRRGRDCLRVRGWPDQELEGLRRLSDAELGRRLAVIPSEIAGRAGSPRPFQTTAGTFEVDADSVFFTPRFAFIQGTSYALIVDGERWSLERPARTGAATSEVVAIYPTAPELPVNQLKLYVRFSAGMSEGWANRALTVRRAEDRESVDGVFLPMEPELWDPQRTRLTMLLDPGRIKRGLAPHEEAGYPLREGVPVLVTVDPAFRDAEGRPLRTRAERRYDVGPPVRVRVDPAAWGIDAPPAGSTAPLTVSFDRPLDRALLEVCLSVAEVAGNATIGPGERSWRFTPVVPWRPGAHRLVVDARLEDLAGNSLTRVFDRDLTRSGDDPLQIASATVEFDCL